MDVNFPPYYTSQILNADGKPVAGGLIRAYLTGTETPAPLFAPDGTPLGSSVSIDAAGNAVFCLRVGTTYRLRCIDAAGAVVWTRDGVRALGETAGIENPMTGAGDMIVGAAGGEPARLAPGAEGDALKIVGGVPTWSTDEEGMQNPMTTKGDLIVGNTDGEPDRLGVGTDGDILATASGTPTWEAGPKKYRNVYKNIPSPDIDDGYLGCLFYLTGSAQALTLPATANIPSKSFIDFVFLDGTATLTITPQGTTTLNAQGSAVTIGGQSATLYRLTFLGHGGSGDEWALGGSGNGDHKVSADGTDTAGYLEDKLDAGSGISLATSAGKVVVSAATQPGDHKTAVDGADASPDYLAAKLAAGSGISLTNTGSAVEIAADAQTGDHKVATSSSDSNPDYLANKLTAGTNVTITNTGSAIEIAASGGGSGVSFEPFGTATDDYTKIYRAPQVWTKTILGGLLPPTIRSFSFYHTVVAPSEIPDFKIMCGIYDKNNDLVSPFTWANHSGVASASTRYKFYSVSFDSPVSINPLERYRVLVWYYSSSSADQRFVKATSPQTGPYYGIGTGALPSDPGNTYGVLPATFPSLTSSSMTNSALWISLNPFAGEY